MKLINVRNDVKEYSIDAKMLLDESLSQIDNYTKLFNLLKEEDSAQNRDDILDQIEYLIEMSSTPTINYVATNSLYNDKSIGRRLKDFYNYKEQLLPELNKILDIYLYIRDDRHEEIKLLIDYSLGNLCLFVIKWFSLNVTYYLYNAKEECDIDFFVSSKFNIDSDDSDNLPVLMELVKEMYKIVKCTNIKIPIFEIQPDIEIPFLEKTSKFIAIVDNIEDNITMTDINVIMNCDNEDDIGKLLKEIEQRGDEGYDLKTSKYFS